MRKNKWIRIGLTVLAISSNLGIQVLAAGPGIVSEVEYDEEYVRKLTDNIIEFDEISDLVHEYNTSIRYAWSKFEEQRDNVIANQDEFKSQKRKMEELMDQAMSAGDVESYSLYAEQYFTFDFVIKGYKKGLDKFDNLATSRNIRMAESMVTMYAESAMIGYHSIKANIRTLEKMRDFYQSQYNLQFQRTELGMGTQTEVLSAQAKLLEAEETLQSLYGMLDNTKRTLMMMLGWTPEDNPEIGVIPALDMNSIEMINLEADIQKAIGNNQTLIEQRNETINHSTKEVEKRRRKVNEGEAKLAIEMERLYDDIHQKQLAYQAALTGAETAALSRTAVETQYRLGMLGEAEYFGAQISYIQKEAAKEAAEISLFQAMEAYRWGVYGFAVVE